MTGICDDIRAAIVESFDEPGAPLRAPRVADHLRGCESCAAFRRRQQALDARLAFSLTPPSLPPEFRRRVRRRIRREKVESVSDWLPGLMQVAAVGIMFFVYLAFAPLSFVSGLSYALVGLLTGWAIVGAVGEWVEDGFS